MRVKNINEFGVSQGILKESKKGVDFLLPIFKRFLNYLQVPWTDTCCGDEGTALPSGGSSNLVYESPDGTLWQIGVNDSGALQTTQVESGTIGTLHLFSPDNTEWNVTVTDAGALQTTAV